MTGIEGSFRRRARAASQLLAAALIVVALAIAGCGDDGNPGLSDTTAAQGTALIGALQIAVNNGANRALAATLSGRRLSGPAANGAATQYGPIARSFSRLRTAPVDVPALAPGIWLHEVVVAATGQHQYRQSLVIADPMHANALAWTLFASVVVVNDPGDKGNGTCDQSCTLREAVATANNKPQPALVVFDHTALGTPAQVLSSKTRITLTARGLTIDGTDANGNPSPVVPFGERIYPTRITLVATKQPTAKADPCPCNDNFGGTLFATGRGSTFIGLQVVRVYPKNPSQICCGNLTLIELGAGSADSRIDTCLLDGGGRLLPNAETPKGDTGQATSKDCVKPENTGSTPEHPIVVSNSEISYCLDRGVKSKNNFLRLDNNWLHNNLRCGLFAIVPSGEIAASGNLIEENGLNCPSGAPPNCVGQVATRPQAPQVSAQGNLTDFALDGNIVRTGPFIGVFWQVNSTGSLANTFVCGMDSVGILAQRSGGAVNGAVIRGSASVLNGDYGVRVRDKVGADLGTDGAANAGHNAFGGNPTNAQVVNELSVSASLAAEGNQWQSCYAATSGPDDCDLTAIREMDTSPADPTTGVDVGNPEPHQGSEGVTLTAVAPTGAAEGTMVRISGAGFDAISGVDGLTKTDCANLAMTNTCTPLNGTCVEFLVDGVWTEAADVLGVTPTAVTVRTPFTCTAPTSMRVRRPIHGGGAVVSNELAFCVN